VLIVSILAVTGYFLTHIVEQKRKNSPEYALNSVVKAIHKKDIKSFTKIVNTQTLSESILKEFLEEPRKVEAEEKTIWNDIKGFGQTIQNRLSGYIKPELINSIEMQMRTYVQNGYFIQKKDLTSFYSDKPILEKLWLDLAGESFKFLGFSNIKETQTEASAYLLFKRDDLNFSSSLTINLEKTKSSWQVVSIDNLGETLNQLETLKIKKIKTKNKTNQDKMNRSLKIQSIEKSEGLTKGQFGEMRILLRVAFENIAKIDIESFKAHVYFKKLDGTLLRQVKIEDTDILPIGEIIEKSWPMTLSPLSKDDHTIFKAKKSDILIDVILKEITFTNGEKLNLIPLESH
jgi:hypothetical protein